MISFIANMKTTQQELNQIREVFLSMDNNKDGRLSMEEIQDGIDKTSGTSFRFSKSGYLDMMKAIDKDYNGYIDY